MRFRGFWVWGLRVELLGLEFGMGFRVSGSGLRVVVEVVVALVGTKLVRVCKITSLTRGITESEQLIRR